jgi:hypothetical protein
MFHAQNITITDLQDSGYDLESPISILFTLKEEDSIKLANKVLAFWYDQGKCGNGDLGVFAWEEDKDNEITRGILSIGSVVMFSVGRVCSDIDHPYLQVIAEGQVDQDSNSYIGTIITAVLNWLDLHLMS